MRDVKEEADSVIAGLDANQHVRRYGKGHLAISHAYKVAIAMPVMSGTETDAFYRGTVLGSNSY